MNARTLLVGSQAAKELNVDLGREPKDTDMFTNTKINGVDGHWHPYYNSWLPEGTMRAATLDELTTIKQSHAYWELENGSWSKHMSDLLKLKEAGGVVIPALHDLLYRVWEQEHGVKILDLDQEAADFFTPAVKRIYDHDSLHHSVAYSPGAPIYEECLKDGAAVLMDMNKVWAMSDERALNMFREEIYVTALERIIVPNDYATSPGAAYQWALCRTITSLTKGRSAKFLVDNFDKLKRADVDYVQVHLDNKKYLKPFDLY